MSHPPATFTQLLSHFDALEDPRTPYLVTHPLMGIIGLTLCAVICGANSWVEIENYGKSKQEWLKTFLELPQGIPSHDTIARLFAALEPTQCQQCFLSWTQAIADLSQGEVIAIDGKTLRHSYDKAQEQGAIHMISAWATGQHLILGQLKVDEKSNEITAIPRLLEMLDIEGCIVTLDAMGTQTAIAQQIIEANADYVLSLKGNQGNLHDEVVQLFELAQQQPPTGVPWEFHQTLNAAHGRIEVRRYYLLGGVEYLVGAQRWVGLQRVGMVESERRIAGEPPSLERRYYLLSSAGGVEQFAQAVRSHWGIENQVHWVLDLTFREDDCRIRKDHAPENLALIRHLALNCLYRARTRYKGSIRSHRLKAGWDDQHLLRILSA